MEIRNAVNGDTRGGRHKELQRRTAGLFVCLSPGVRLIRDIKRGGEKRVPCLNSYPFKGLIFHHFPYAFLGKCISKEKERGGDWG